ALPTVPRRTAGGAAGGAAALRGPGGPTPFTPRWSLIRSLSAAPWIAERAGGITMRNQLDRAYDSPAQMARCRGTRARRWQRGHRGFSLARAVPTVDPRLPGDTSRAYYGYPEGVFYPGGALRRAQGTECHS